MPWVDGEPPKDGRPYVCETPSFSEPLFLAWTRMNGLAAWRDWDCDTYSDVTRWHPLDPQ